MQLATLIGEIVSSGKIKVSTNDTEAVEISVSDKKFDINAVNKEIVKEVLKATTRSKSDKTITGSLGKIKKLKSDLDVLKDVAEELSEAGVTVTLSYKGSLVATIGSQASPKLSKIVTGTKAIEVNSPLKLIEMSI